ncbi:TniQ family protein [Psychrobacter glacincola]|uniref:TniQ family protein n=1 Tax=Psychrobacter glacincola TaxID=56810 RepID=UPI003FCF3A55
MKKKYQGLELSYRLQLLPICKDELIRSWLVRNALFFNMKPAQLSTIIFQNTDVWKSDIDVQLSKRSIQSLLNAVEILEKDLHQTLISSKCGNFYPHLNDSKQVKWLLQLGVHQRRQKNSLQYCPACIASDKTPYFRTYWRLGFLTACHIHNICFLDDCPNCNYPIDLVRYKKTNDIPFEPLDYLKCDQCSFDLRDAPRIKPSHYELEANREHFNLLVEGYGSVGNLSFSYSHIYYDGLKRIMSLFLCSEKGIDMFEYIVNAYDLNTGYNERRAEISLHSEPDHLPIQMRKIGIIFSHHIMKDWPVSFIKICKKFGVTKRFIYSPYLKYPFWLQEIIDLELN